MNYYEELLAIIELIERYQGEYQEQLGVESSLESLRKIRKEDNPVYNEIEEQIQNLIIQQQKTLSIIEDLLKQKREIEKQLFSEK